MTTCCEGYKQVTSGYKSAGKGVSEAQLAPVRWGSGGSSRKASKNNDPKAKTGRIGQMPTGYLSGGRSYRFAFEGLRHLWEDKLGRAKQNSRDQCFRWDQKDLKSCAWIPLGSRRPQEEELLKGLGKDGMEHGRPGKSTMCPLYTWVDFTDSYEYEFFSSVVIMDPSPTPLAPSLCTVDGLEIRGALTQLRANWP